MLKIGEIRELIRLLDETSIAELKLEQDDMKLHLKKADTSVAFAPPVAAPIPTVQPAAPMHQTIQQTPIEPTATTVPPVAQDELDEKMFRLIKSPMVGTFYRSSSPDVPPYVDLGVAVEPKTIVCIVEAMKLMNEIEAEISGEVVDVLAENGQLVEYGQPLFRIRLA